MTHKPRLRIGHGFDLHRLEPGRRLIVGGIELAHDRGCVAHSDGDVLFHAVVDSIFGALGLDDLGSVFPDSDPQWQGAGSGQFVKEAIRQAAQGGYAIGNLDATIVLQRPKVSPYKEQICRNLVSVLGCHRSQVNVKGKTHELVDAIGQGDAISCHVVVLLEEQTIV